MARASEPVASRAQCELPVPISNCRFEGKIPAFKSGIWTIGNRQSAMSDSPPHPYFPASRRQGLLIPLPTFPLRFTRSICNRRNLFYRDSIMLMKYRLFTPGPTSVPEATLLELAKPVHHHRTGEFRAMFNELQSMLQYVFQTKSTVYTITGSGTAAFETGFVNVLQPGQKASDRHQRQIRRSGWSSYATTFGIEKKELKIEYGTHVTDEQIANELKAAKYDAVILVHSETSTGTVCDLQAIAKAVRASGDTLLIVDGITSIGAMPFKMDEWGVDVAITGSQKAARLMLPPGLGFVLAAVRPPRWSCRR